MNSFLFDEWVKELDKKFEKENRKVIIIVGNCPAHLIIGFESCGACVSATKHNFKNTTYGPRCGTFPKQNIAKK